MSSPYHQLWNVLQGEPTERVPFTVYENLLPPCEAERKLRDRGVVVVDRTVPAFNTHWQEVRVHDVVWQEPGRAMRRRHYETPAGDLTTEFATEGGITRCTRKMFTNPDDYPAILALIRSERYIANHAAVSEQIKRWGGDGIVRVGPGLEPMQRLVSSDMMDMTDWAMQWMENRDEVLSLYDALVEQRRMTYPILRQSPAMIMNYGGNVTVEIIGLEVFEKYYLPHYAELVEAVTGSGKKVGCHFDANCGLMRDLIARTPLDYIEAFTPAPDTDMTLTEARKAWPDKVLWINFPSSIHLASNERIEQTTRELLDSIDARQGLIMGVTETVPSDRWSQSFHAIADGLGLPYPNCIGRGS